MKEQLNRHGLPILESVPSNAWKRTEQVAPVESPLLLVRKTTKRMRLHRQDPHCFWCGELTLLDVDPSKDPRAATVDHLYSRLHPERRAKRGHDRTELLHVLACRGCNLARGFAEQRGKVFKPKLKHRQGFAFNTSAVIARQEMKAVTLGIKTTPLVPYSPIDTIESAYRFARDECLQCSRTALRDRLCAACLNGAPQT